MTRPIKSAPTALNTERRSRSAGNRASDRLARLYFDYALSGIFQTQRDGTILEANPAAASITGRDRRQLEGLNLQHLFTAASPERLQRHWALLQEQGISQVELLLRLKDGRELIIEMASIQADDEAFLHIFDDVTVQRAATTEIENARKAAEAANRMKSDFLANVSHEIRTPLNGILGLSQLALQGTLPTETREYLDAILRSGRNLLALVNDLLDSAKIEAGKFALDTHPFLLADLITDLKDMRSAVPLEKPISVQFSVASDLPICLLGDRLRIGQCLRNVLGNAIKFTASGQVTLNVDKVDEGGTEWLCYCVTDTGIGIAPEVLLRLFSPFSQADASTSRRFGGSGLGLYLARELARSMGGELLAESRLGTGSRFTLRLPLVSASLDAGDTQPEVYDVPQEFRGQLVLLVEDDPTNRLVATHWLAKAGIESRVAHDGHEAITQAQAQPLPALILMDVQMPGLDGLATTRKLRELGYVLPIIGLSAGAGQIEQDACLAAGMSDFLPKPIDLDELWGCLTRWLPPSTATTAFLKPEEAAIDRFLGDQDVLDKAKKLFALTHGCDGETLLSALAAGDFPAIKRIAHGLKGAAATLGYRELVDQCSAIEHALVDSSSNDTVAAHVDAINRLLTILTR